MKRDDFAGVLDLDYMRRCYDEALRFARFKAEQLEKTLNAMQGSYPALYASQCANVRALINEFARANYLLERSYFHLLEANEWDDDTAREAGITEREVKL